MKIAEKVGADRLNKMLTNFGFGPDGTAKDFPAARSGVLPPSTNPLWPELIPAISAGYGFKATPIELIQAYGAIANGGKLLRPKQANESSTPQVIRRVLSTESAEITREILKQVVLKGTAKDRGSSKLYSTAGKTTTSYFPDSRETAHISDEKHGIFAGFIGFAPVKNPQVEVYVGIYEPRDGFHENREGYQSGAHGSVHAAPIFKRIIEETLQHLKVKPDKI